MTNDALREHVTSVGFSLTLSKNQIDTLVLMHYAGGGFNKFHRAFRDRISNNYCTTAGALIRRGLMRDHGPGVAPVACELCDEKYCDHRLTRAGVLLADLLTQAGIYQEVLARYSVDQKDDAA